MCFHQRQVGFTLVMANRLMVRLYEGTRKWMLIIRCRQRHPGRNGPCLRPEYFPHPVFTLSSTALMSALILLLILATVLPPTVSLGKVGIIAAGNWRLGRL